MLENETNAPNSEEKEELDGIENPEKNENGEQTPENKEQEDKSPSENKEIEDDKEDDKKEVPNYRPNAENKPDPATGKIIAQKQRIKELEAEIEGLKSVSNKPNNEDYEALAEELGVSVEVVKKLKDNPNSSQEIAELRKELSEIRNEKQQIENERNFKLDFERWSKDNPDRKSKEEFFKKIAFDPEYTHLKNLDEIEKHFFPNANTKNAKTEKGSLGDGKKSKVVDLNKMTPEEEKQVLENPKTRSQYVDKLLDDDNSFMV